MRNLITVLSILVVVALMALSFAAGLVAGSRPTSAPPTTPSPTTRPTPTRPATPSPTPTALPGIRADAVVVPVTSADVSSPITAIVEAVFIREGQQVTAGQLLMRLDTTTRHAAVEVAEADLNRALAAADRAQTALDQLPADASTAQRDAAQADLRLAQAELELARSALAAAQASLRQTEIRTPIAGRVAGVGVAVAEQAVAGETVATIADMSEWHVITTSIGELDVVGIAVGDPAVITFSALPGVELPGVVSQIRARGTTVPGGVRFEVVIAPQEHLEELRWNMTAQVRILPDR